MLSSRSKAHLEDEESPAARPSANNPDYRRVMVIGLLVALGIVAGIALWLLALGGQASGSGQSAQKSGIEVKVGLTAPDFELEDVKTGSPVRLSALRGKPVWINFWATWCPPCRAEMPIMKQKYEKYGAAGLEVVGINMREDPAYVRSFAAENGYNWLFAVDRDGEVTNRYFASGIPTHLFVDAAGTVQAIHIGDLHAAAMDELLEKILVE